VLHARCVDLAARERVPLTVRSSFTDASGTRIVEEGVEAPRVEALAHQKDVTVVIAEGTSGGRGEARGILEAVAEAFPALQLVAHEKLTEAHGALVWTGPREDAEALQKQFRDLRGPGGEWSLTLQHDAAFVSLIGLGLGAAEGARGEGALEKAGVEMLALRVTLRNPPGTARGLWLTLVPLLGFLAINKQLDLQTALTATGRCMAQAEGWYDNRALVQIGFIAGLMLAETEYRRAVEAIMEPFKGLLLLSSCRPQPRSHGGRGRACNDRQHCNRCPGPEGRNHLRAGARLPGGQACSIGNGIAAGSIR
jgi:hypothetical protein